MDKFPSNCGWMNDMCHKGRGALKESFVLRVEEFITKACQRDSYHNDGGVRCPCSKCDCTMILKERVVKVHFYKHGFKPNYRIWSDHGERMPEGHFDNDDNCMGSQEMTHLCRCKTWFMMLLTNVSHSNDQIWITWKRLRKKKLKDFITFCWMQISRCMKGLQTLNYLCVLGY